MQSISTWIAKVLMRAKALDKKGTEHAFGTPERILEDCQSLRKFWIPSDASADRLAPIFLDNRIKEMCDAIRLLGGTPPVIPQSISSVDEGMRAVDLIVEWSKSQEATDPDPLLVTLLDLEQITAGSVKKRTIQNRPSYKDLPAVKGKKGRNGQKLHLYSDVVAWWANQGFSEGIPQTSAKASETLLLMEVSN